MTISDMLQYAIKYCYKKTNDYPIADYTLNPALQYLLCQAWENLNEEFAEVTKKDIALLIEAWVMAQGTLRPNHPIRPKRQPSNVSDYEYLISNMDIK